MRSAKFNVCKNSETHEKISPKLCNGTHCDISEIKDKRIIIHLALYHEYTVGVVAREMLYR